MNYKWFDLSLCLKIAYTEEHMQQRGKGSFPAMITPGYHLAKKAQENASDVSMKFLRQNLPNVFGKQVVCCKTCVCYVNMCRSAV